MRFHLLVPLAAPLVLGACATPTPYAEVTAERIRQADFHEATVRIMGVDGRLDPTGSHTLQIDPGKRQLLVATSRHEERRPSPQAQLLLDARACMRYYLVARHASAFRVEPWTLELARVEPIPECEARFPNASPPPPASTVTKAAG